MHLSALTTPALAVLLTTLHCHADAQAVTCEELRARIEAKIRSNGVKDFTVEVFEAATRVQGRVVGTCGGGERKLVYTKGKASGPVPVQPPPAAGASAAHTARPKATPVITECADGRVITTGSCKSS